MQAQGQVERAKALAAAGRLDEALDLLTPLTEQADAPWQALSVQADLLKRAGRLADSAAMSRRLVAVRPQSVPARHNLASTLGDLGQAAEAEAVCRQAMALGGDAPETWLVLGRALQAQSRFEAAEDAYRQALARRPGYDEALRDLSQLIWMRDADLAAAIAPLDAAIAAAPGASGPRQTKARLLEYAGEVEPAYLALTDGPLDGPGELAAAQACLALDPQRALEHVRRAATLAGRPVAAIMVTQAECLLALGQPEAALVPIEALRALEPLNQHVLAHQATAWRMLGDARYQRLYDYDAFVRPYRLEAPQGWATLEAYLVDLARALNRLHTLKTHPVGQSLRGGSQTAASLAQSDDPAIRAFFDAIDAPIRAYMAALGQGTTRCGRAIRGDTASRAAGPCGCGPRDFTPTISIPMAGCRRPAISNCPRRFKDMVRAKARRGGARAGCGSARRRACLSLKPSTMCSRSRGRWFCSPPICGTAPSRSAARRRA